MALKSFNLVGCLPVRRRIVSVAVAAVLGATACSSTVDGWDSVGAARAADDSAPTADLGSIERPAGEGAPGATDASADTAFGGQRPQGGETSAGEPVGGYSERLADPQNGSAGQPPPGANGTDGDQAFETFDPDPLSEPAPDSLPEVEVPEVPSPTDVERSPAIVLADVPEGEEILDTVVAIDEVPVASERGDLRDGHRRNEVGSLVVLDGAGALACGQIEVALTRLDDGDRAGAVSLIDLAADNAAAAAEPFPSWAPRLRDAARESDGVDPTELVGFLTACVDGGYEL